MFAQRREVGYLHIVYMCARCTIRCVLTFDQPCTVSMVDLVIVVLCCSLLRELSEPASGGCEGTSEGGVLLAEGGPLRLTQLFPSLEARGAKPLYYSYCGGAIPPPPPWSRPGPTVL